MAEPPQLESLDSEKWFGIQGFTNFTAAHFVAKCYTVNAGEGYMTGALTPLTFQKGGNGGRMCLLIAVSQAISRFIKIDFKQFIAAIPPHRKFRIIF